MQRKHLVAALAAVALAGTALGGPAVADGPSAKPTAKTIVGGLIGPLSLDVTDDGTVYYSQNFAGLLNRKKPGKSPKTLYQAPEGTEVGAVSERKGNVRFAITKPGPSEFENGPAFLMGIGDSGKARSLANLTAYETKKNPDGDVVYNLRGLPDDCEVPEDFQPYEGIVDSHPYATVQTRRSTFIADAAGNDILKYNRKGKLSTVAVLPAQPILVTEEVAAGAGLPECTVGLKYYFEPVPTDVERGPDGKLYVTTLPGGPEDPSLGARAAVYRVNPKTGRTKKVASGLLSATGVAVADNGTLFVAELFGGRIVKIKPGSQPKTYLNTALPGDVELRSNGDLYATVNVLPSEEEPPDGRVVRIRN